MNNAEVKSKILSMLYIIIMINVCRK